MRLPAIHTELAHPILYPPASGHISIGIRAFYEIEASKSFALLVRCPTEKVQSPEDINEKFLVKLDNLVVFRLGTLLEYREGEDIRIASSNVLIHVDAPHFFLADKLILVNDYVLHAEGNAVPILFMHGENWWKDAIKVLENELMQSRNIAMEVRQMGGDPLPVVEVPAELWNDYKSILPQVLSACISASFLLYPQLVYNFMEDVEKEFSEHGVVYAETVLKHVIAMAKAITQHNAAIRDTITQVIEENQRIDKMVALTRLRKAVDEEIKKLSGQPSLRDTAYLTELLEKAKERNLPTEVKTYITEELKRIIASPTALGMWVETEVALKHIEFLLALPWDKRAEEMPELERAEKLLEEHFYGMRTVKQKVLDYIATVKHLNTPSLKGTVLCFIGVPGTGKTDVARIIAAALGRPFYRIPLGGVNDEAVIKGHRRTYVGAMPGNIMKALAQVGVKNPVILLDEVDKLGMGLRGDPAAALLDALDPDHNHSFFDHYVDFPFDLSEVVFICAANVWENINPTLRDRFDRVDFHPYTPAAKVMIAKNFLLPRWHETLKIPPKSVKITDEALLKLIREYTFEGGVRNLNNLLKVILQRHLRGITPKQVRPQDIPKILWDLSPIHRSKRKEKLDIGVAPILGVYPQTGDGELSYIEIYPLSGARQSKWVMQGDDIFKSSFDAALIYLERKYQDPNIVRRGYGIFKTSPAVEVSGTSAGLSIALALISLIEGKPLPPNFAYSGEISPSGAIYPVGGIAQKVVLAETCGFSDLILPSANKIDVELLDFEPQIKIHFVEHIEQALELIGWKEKPKGRARQKHA